MKTGDWAFLCDLREGSLFETVGGIRAVKSEYHYPNGVCQCVLLESGEYFHPSKGNKEIVREILLSEEEATGKPALLPCPFCGGAAGIGAGAIPGGILTREKDAYYFVNCVECMASTNILNPESSQPTREEAIEAWNRRTP